jgi:HYR domain-containing protein
MRRSTGISTLLTVFRAGSVAAVLSAMTVSCSDTTAPNWGMPAGVTYVRLDDAAAKQAFLEQNPISPNAVAPMSADVVVTPGAALSVAAGGFRYVKSHPAFNPEAVPNIIVPQDSLSDDGIVQHIPLGFDFEFYGNVYSEVNIYSNGFLKFGDAVTSKPLANFFRGDAIPDPADPNNIIAFAWTDWNPKKVVGGVRFETRGEAPNRRFVLQFNNVPEALGRGLLMMQLVLNETTNSIVIYTNTMSITNSGDRVTQGIENADGSMAAFDSVTNAINGVVSARVRGFFGLTNDAVQFTPPRPPRVFAPKDLMVPTTSPSSGTERSVSFSALVGSCDANVDPGMATATGDAQIVSVVGVRSDDATLPLVGKYPKGLTTINWTATDENGVNARASQLVTVVDKENPIVSAPADVTADNAPGLPSAVVSAGSASSADNCHDEKLSSARSDGAAMDAPFMVGVTSITWTATDGSGNTASAKQSITVRDVEAPKIFVPARVTLPANSPSGAVVNYQVSATDNVAVSSLDCTMPSGSTFPIGVTPVECTAADAAGNSKAASFDVTVYDAPTQMSNLIQYVLGLGMSNGVTNPLVNQLQAAFSQFGGDNHVACVKMNDFISMVSKKSSGIPVGSVPYMNTEAGRIIAVLACPTTRDHPANK